MVPLLFLLLGCGRDASVVARVGSQEVDAERLQRYLESETREPWQEVDARVASRLLDQFLDQEVVAEAARSLSEGRLPIDPDRRWAAVRALLPEVCGPAPAPADETVAEILAGRTEQPRPRSVRVRQMLFPSLEIARAAVDRLAAGDPWIEVSRDLSLAPNASDGGIVGRLTEGTLAPELDAVIFTLEEEEVSAPVEGPGGYHVFQVLEIAPAGPQSRAEISSAVRDELARSSEREHTRRCVRRLAAEIGVEVLPEHLWYAYDGRYGDSEDRT